MQHICVTMNIYTAQEYKPQTLDSLIFGYSYPDKNRDNFFLYKNHTKEFDTNPSIAPLPQYSTNK